MRKVILLLILCIMFIISSLKGKKFKINQYTPPNNNLKKEMIDSQCPADGVLPLSLYTTCIHTCTLIQKNSYQRSF